ncbi:uncharacterized protein TRIVIDRAFT_212366 [Trichoderma virens Gv29-8]|uniref:Uncharacterized protein n=1 Tax=Hypocrea virens (strain Gv29-8 / FGSC 10586) TaxID=413071 RepID=G9MKY0_HYPVG|nr:uncharacterized protein TRIVIDRAFT_212366 [Trichoderma virens Gv29-8]EHK24875.1 hypothetical protein TRIVIDRAFT_212366 [Trichoderma virens Gv29-8]UKZ55142.1 hypothetical protein TrVGV298_008959 [Trichoderma virens]
MSPNPTMKAALLALLLRPVHAQFSNWADDQINTTICTWSAPRGGQGTNGESPNYLDGALLGNDDEFFFYGGLPFKDTIQYADPTAQGLYSYQAYQYGLNKPLFEPGLHRLDNLPKTVSQFVTYGGAARAPSENLAWYFSGETSQSGKSIFSNFNDTTRPSLISNSLITVNLTIQGDESWSNKTLPPSVKGRASPALVWVPVGAKGILVALGGVVYPEYANASRQSQNAKASEAQSPKFMQTIDVYDVAGDKWYSQPTEKGPGARARGCAVLATASDSTSFNIYYYGGYEAIGGSEPYHDDVWVLSLPSFTWTLINNGTSSHGRVGHQCFTPYPDQMMIIGGDTTLAGSTIECLENGPVVMFNLTSGEWMDSYDPTVYGNYGVPDKVQAVIGGKASGSATATQPAVSGWVNPDLGKVFATSYDQKKITTYWPYPAAQTTNPPAQSPPPSPPKSGGLPSWVGPVLGVILGLIALTCIIVLFCLWRRRKNLKNRTSTNTSEENGRRILSWIRGQPPPHKAATETTTEDTPASPEMREYIYPSFTPSNSASVPPQAHEMDDTQLVELDDTTRVELQDTGLSPMDIRERYSHWFHGRANDGLPSPTRSSLQSTSPRNTISPIRDRNSEISQTGLSDSPSPRIPEAGENDEKSLLPTPDPIATPATEDKAQASDGSARTSEGQEFVVSPPTAEENPGDDYLTVKKSSSNSPTTRKSVFQEHHED